MQQTKDLRQYLVRLAMSRVRILTNYGFYGLLLMHVTLSVDENIETAQTDGDYITFSPSFMDELDDDSLDFVLMHEVLHIALQHCYRGAKRNNEIFNIACDIVVNSNILKSMNKLPNDFMLYEKFGIINKTPYKEDGYKYTAEEVFEMLLTKYNNSQSNSDKDDTEEDENFNSSFDSHGEWKENENSDKEDEWMRRVVNAALQAQGYDNTAAPYSIERLIKELQEGVIDWRTVLHEFIQTSTYDYSLLPPDRRFSDSDFFLPDLNDLEEVDPDILFFVDTSGSISDTLLNETYSEIASAISQFNGKLCGWLGFFDTHIYDPIKFENVTDLKEIMPIGGGGTDFHIIFEYVNKVFIQKHKPKAVVILTDGGAEFPKQNPTEIPVLWIICGTNIVPPFGTYVHRKK